jgi:hypothetical protein
VRNTLLLALAVLIGLLAPLGLWQTAFAQGKSRDSGILPVRDIKPGMKGYGLTVFKGTEPEQFAVSVIGVLKNFQPRQDLILIKTKHPRLAVTKVVAGMSGSPIFINHKMVGAYAYGWTFGEEPVAGVTPIQNMLNELHRPIPKMINGWPLVPGPPHGKRQARRSMSSVNRYAGSLDHYDLDQHARQIEKHNALMLPGSSSPARPVDTPLLMGGMTSSAMGLAKKLLSPLGLAPLQAGGGGSAEQAGGGPNHFVDGGAIGVQLIRGDMSAMGLGTVTSVHGNKLVAFGHPMMQSGVTALPTCTGKVLWFLASKMRSFKIGEPLRPLGALVNDRLAAIVVDENVKAPVIPVTMHIKGVDGAPVTDWKFQVAEEKFMSPAFLAIALGNALQATAAERQDVSWTAQSHLAIHGHGSIDLEDFGVAIGGTPDPQDFVRSNLVRSMGALMNNPWQPVLIDGVEMTIRLRYARDILRLRGSEILDPEVQAGQAARIRLTLIPYASKPVTRIVSVPIPAHLAGKTLSLEISPGYTEERDLADPDNLGALIHNLAHATYPPKSVIISFNAGDGAVSYKGHVAKDLPPGALDAIRPTSSSVAPDTFRSETRLVVPLPDFMTGQDHVSVEVKPVLH